MMMTAWTGLHPRMYTGTTKPRQSSTRPRGTRLITGPCSEHQIALVTCACVGGPCVNDPWLYPSIYGTWPVKYWHHQCNDVNSTAMR